MITATGVSAQDCLTDVGLFFDSVGNVEGLIAPGYAADDTGFIGCKVCHSTCLTCQGGTDKDCLTCDSDHWLFNFYGKACIANFYPGVSGCLSTEFYQHYTQSCQPCDPSCKTCELHATSCKTCNSPMLHVQDQNICVNVTDCPTGFYPNPPINRCTYKYGGCITYDEVNKNICLECFKGHVVVNNNSCRNIVNGGYYMLANPLKAYTCDASCGGMCNGPGPGGCSSCNQYENPATPGSCGACGTGTYYDHVNRLCGSCDPSCYKCVGPTASDCTSCSGSLLYQSGICGSTCATGFYGDTGNGDCQPCHSTCYHCTGPLTNQCSGIDASLPNAKAERGRHRECPVDYLNYQGRCQPAWPTGITFRHPQFIVMRDWVRSCIPGYTVLLGYYYYDNNPASPTYQRVDHYGRCATFPPANPDNCPPGYSNILAGSQQCISCLSDCADCTRTGSEFEVRVCNLCSKNMKVPYGGTTCADAICSPVATAPDKFRYPQIGVDTCGSKADGNCAHVTDAQCDGCHNLWDTKCPQCLTTTHIVHRGVCVLKSVHIDGYFWQDPNTIKQCQPGCKICNSDALDQCTECRDDSFMMEDTSGSGIGDCFLECDDGFIGFNKLCNLCDASCKKCLPTDPYSCTECYAGVYYTDDIKKCSEGGCFSGYLIGPSFQCFKCDPICLECIDAGPQGCISCQPPLLYRSDNSECATSCPSDFYESSQKCYPCDPTCKTCDGQTSNNCLSCYPGKLLQTDGKCQTTCDVGSFLSTTGLSCSDCSVLCDDCDTELPEDCITCKTGAYQLEDNSCVGDCTNGNYLVQPANKICASCDISCKTCTGGESNNCTECYPGVEYDGAENTCKCTQNGQYLDDGYCLQCDNSCLTCNGPGPNSCLSCFTDLILALDKTCQANCLDGSFLGTSGTCEACHESCSQCTGGNENECTKCSSQYFYFDAVNGTCKSCLLPIEEDIGTMCNHVQKLSVKEEFEYFDLYSSNTIDVSFQNIAEHADFLKTLSEETIGTYLNATVRFLQEDQYTLKWRIFELDEVIKLQILVNFTQTQNRAEIQVEPFKLHWYLDPLTEQSKLSIVDEPVNIMVAGKAPESVAALNQANNLSEKMNNAKGLIAVITSASLAVTTLGAGVPSGPIIQIVKLFKILFRLRLVNTFFGTLVDVFLNQIGNILKQSSYEFTDQDVKYFVNTRGKLTKYQITIFSSYILFDKILIYLILKLIQITTFRIKKNISDPDKLNKVDTYLIEIVDRFITILILSGIYDFTLYCSHEILHHDMQIVQTSHTNISYYESCLCLCLVLYEIISIFEKLRKLDISKIEKFHAKCNKIKEYILKAEDHENKLKARQRLDYYLRKYKYEQGSMIIFFTDAIKPEHLKKWTGLFHRFALMMKLVFFEILIVSLQMLPRTQLMFITLVQTITIIIIIKALFKDSIYTHKFFGFMDVLSEGAVFAFILVGNISTWIGSENLNATTWTNMQLTIIYLIMFTAIMNIVLIVYNVILNFKKSKSEKKYKVSKKKPKGEKGKSLITGKKLLFDENALHSVDQKEAPKPEFENSLLMELNRDELCFNPEDAGTNQNKDNSLKSIMNLKKKGKNLKKKTRSKKALKKNKLKGGTSIKTNSKLKKYKKKKNLIKSQDQMPQPLNVHVKSKTLKLTKTNKSTLNSNNNIADTQCKKTM